MDGDSKDELPGLGMSAEEANTTTTQGRGLAKVLGPADNAERRAEATARLVAMGLDLAEVESMINTWTEIAKLLGPENCRALKAWIETRHSAIEEIENQPFFRGVTK